MRVLSRCLMIYPGISAILFSRGLPASLEVPAVPQAGSGVGFAGYLPCRRSGTEHPMFVLLFSPIPECLVLPAVSCYVVHIGDIDEINSSVE